MGRNMYAGVQSFEIPSQSGTMENHREPQSTHLGLLGHQAISRAPQYWQPPSQLLSGHKHVGGAKFHVQSSHSVSFTAHTENRI